ncbi:MAG: radical SAM family heme chaperone HemW [Bacteroidales bacterium]|nr:radical SAM family heme chaperone HemW [Bacteroidales bacterium]
MAGIYIHIPFCKKLCSYCDFYHLTDLTNSRLFIDAVVREAEMRKGYLSNDKVSTVYFGGGTPSILPPDDLKEIYSAIRSSYDICDNSEVTIEVNPDDVTNELLSAYRNIGINRISIGIQSWRNDDLRLLNRRHNASQAALSIEEAIKAGFGNISVDLIYGIPGMTLKDWSSNIEITLGFDIKHLSAYHLTFEKGTALSRMKEKGLVSEVDEEESNSQFHLLLERTQAAGLIQYEISNFAKKDFFSIHNSNYWKQVNYIGLGPSAHSFNGYSRQWNTRDLKTYFDGIFSGNLSYEREELDTKTRFNEYIMTSLRTMWGIDLDYVEKTFDKEGYDYLTNLAGKFINYGLMNQDKNTLVLTNQGKMISDNIISELMLPGND